ETTEFQDIDDAWSDAVKALDQAGIQVSDLPLFLVFGQPAGGEKTFFEAAQLSLTVSHEPSGDRPLHVYANRDAIFVTCAGASLSGRQAADLGRAVVPGMNGPPPMDAEYYSQNPDDIFKTNLPKKQQARIRDIIRRAHEERRALTEEDQ